MTRHDIDLNLPRRRRFLHAGANLFLVFLGFVAAFDIFAVDNLIVAGLVGVTALGLAFAKSSYEIAAENLIVAGHEYIEALEERIMLFLGEVDE